MTSNITYVNYESEAQMPHIIELCQRDLSEPYSVYTYRYFINNWSKLCFLAYDDTQCVGAIVGKLDDATRGYLAMLAVKKEYRRKRIGHELVRLALTAMRDLNVEEVILETETTNKPALKLYENLGFIRDRCFFRYYLNGEDAFRLRLRMRTVTDSMASVSLENSQSNVAQPS